jgi:hypothetical protein
MRCKNIFHKAIESLSLIKLLILLRQTSTSPLLGFQMTASLTGLIPLVFGSLRCSTLPLYKIFQPKNAVAFLGKI